MKIGQRPSKTNCSSKARFNSRPNRSIHLCKEDVARRRWMTGSAQDPAELVREFLHLARNCVAGPFSRHDRKPGIEEEPQAEKENGPWNPLNQPSSGRPQRSAVGAERSQRFAVALHE